MQLRSLQVYVLHRSIQIIGPLGPTFKVIVINFKVIESDTVRLGTCDFLLATIILRVINKNCGLMSYHFRDQERYWLKTTNCPYSKVDEVANVVAL